MKNAYELYYEGEKIGNRSIYWTLFFIINIVSMLYFRDILHKYIDMKDIKNIILLMTYMILPILPSMYTMAESNWIKQEARRNYGYNSEEHY